jgi:transcriptional regulator with XRE-family HTH domain
VAVLRSGSVVRRRLLGRRLRLLREGAGLTLEGAAPRLEWSASKLSRIETGQQSVDVHGVRSMLDLYDGGHCWEEVLTLTREARQRGWWRAYGVGDDSYVGFETEAVTVSDFTIDYVPGLLQTPAYARALMTGTLVARTEQELRGAVAVRSIRQERLHAGTDRPLELAAVVSEAALHHAVGGPDVLAEQRAHLAAAARWPSVRLQVLPSAVPRRVVEGSGFTVLGFGDLGEPDLAYVEHALGALMMDKEADVARARLGFDRLRSDALSPADTLALLDGLAAG